MHIVLTCTPVRTGQRSTPHAPGKKEMPPADKTTGDSYPDATINLLAFSKKKKSTLTLESVGKCWDCVSDHIPFKVYSNVQKMY